MTLKITCGAGVSDELALRVVGKVVAMGKISNKKTGPCYCFITTFDTDVGEVVVYSRRTPGITFTFLVSLRQIETPETAPNRD